MPDNLPHDPCGRGVFFDRETFGTDHLAADVGQRPWREALRGAPLADRARDDIVRLHEAAIDYLCANFLSHRVWDSYHGRLGSGPRSVRKPVPTPGSTAATPELETRAAHPSRNTEAVEAEVLTAGLPGRLWRNVVGADATTPADGRRADPNSEVPCVGSSTAAPCSPPARAASLPGRPAAGGSARAGAGRRPSPAPDRPPVARPLHASPHGRGAVLRPAVGIGEVMLGATVAEVVGSRHPGFREGELVLGPAAGRTMPRWTATGSASSTRPRHRLPPRSACWACRAHRLRGPLGDRATDARRDGSGGGGDRAGGRGGGSARELKGARAVGIAGGPEKARALVEEFGFDAALDHRAPEFPDRLQAACPNGIDVYFENVGGAVLGGGAAAARTTRARAGVRPCRALQPAGGPAEGPDALPALMLQVLVRRLVLRGFIVSDFADQEPAFLAGYERLGARGPGAGTASRWWKAWSVPPRPSPDCSGARTSASSSCTSAPTPWRDPSGLHPAPAGTTSTRSAPATLGVGRHDTRMARSERPAATGGELVLRGSDHDGP